MATSLTTEQYYDGTASQTNFAFTFPYTKESDVKVEHPIGTVLTQKTASAANDYEFLTATTIKFTQAPASGTDNVKIYRATNVDSAKAVFASGSTIRATDLNSSLEHVLFSRQDRIQTDDLTDQAITAAKIKNDTITAAQLATDSVGALELADNSVASANIINGSIVDADINASAAIAGSKLAASTSSVAGSMSAADKAKLDGIETGATADQTNAEIRAAVEAASDSNVFTDADHSKLNAIEANATADQTNAEIRAAVEAASDSNVFTDADHTKLNSIASSANNYTHPNHSGDVTSSGDGATTIANDAVTYAKMQNVSATDRVLGRDSSGAGIVEEIAPAALRTMINVEDGATADQSNAEIKTAYEANSNTNAFTDANKTLVDAITATATELNVLDGVTASTAELNMMDNCTAVGTELSVLDGITANTNELNILDGVTANKDELNLLDGKSIVTTIAANATDVQLPTAQAVNERIVTVMQDAGGFVPIADDQSFPNTNPDPNDDAGTIVSIADAGGLVVNGSGVTTTGRTLGGSTVTINGIDSSLHSSTIAAGKGMLVETTSTLNTYTYHRLVVDEAGVANAQTLVNDFNSRYRVGSSNPTSSLDDGDLFFNTTSDKMLVYNATGSSWDEVQSVGNFFINTISSYSGTGGNSATFNGSAYRFVLSNAGTYAQQHVVSVNGVIQKPNSGTSQPAEGFAIDGSSIIFSSAPASGSDYFIITIGAAVNIGSPSNNTVTSASIVDGSIVNADVSSSAAIVGSKLADDSITEAKLDIHAAPSGTDKFLKYTSNGMEWVVPSDTNTNVLAGGTITGDVIFDNATNAGNDLTWDMSDNALEFDDSVKATFGDGADLQIYHDGSNSYLSHSGDGHLYIQTAGANESIKIRSTKHITLYVNDQTEEALVANENGAVELYYDNSKKFETTSAGIKITGNNLVLNDSGAFFIDHPTTGQVINFRVSDSSSNDTTALTILSDGMNSHADNIKSAWGSSNDIRIWHDGTDSHVKNSTGPLYVQADSLFLASENSESYIQCAVNGSVILYYDNSQIFETFSWGARVHGNLSLVDNKHLYVGAGNDLDIYHNGTNTFIENDEGVLFIRAKAGENSINCFPNGSVNLFYDNTKVLETYDASSYSGITVLGDEGGHAVVNLHADEGDDAGDKWQWTAQTNGASYIKNFSNGSTYEYNVKMIGGGPVELYCNGVKKFETHSDGIQVLGAEGADGVIYLMADEADDQADQWKFNAAAAGGFFLENKTSGSWETNIKAVGNGAVELYYDNSKKLETWSGGVTVTGGAYSNETNGTSFKAEDGGKFIAGGGNDLQLFHDGTRSHIYNTTGDLRIRSDDVTIRGVNDEICAAFYENSSVDLYHNNSKKFETLSGGAKVSGALTVTDALNFNAHDNQKIKLGESDDLQIYHDGTNSKIHNATGTLGIRADNFHINNAADNENLATLTANGAVNLYYDHSKKLETTSSGVTITGDLTVTGSGAGLFSAYAILMEVQAHGTAGTNTTPGDWETRVLNEEYADPSNIVSLSSNEFTLGAGTYLVKWCSTFWRLDYVKTRLYDVTNSAVKKSSINAFSQNASGNYSSINSNGIARFTITGDTVYKLQYFCSSTDTGSTGGGGMGPTDTDNTEEEIYTQVEIWKES